MTRASSVATCAPTWPTSLTSAPSANTVPGTITSCSATEGRTRGRSPSSAPNVTTARRRGAN
ncbi:UNVERIFIED_CONTAM: hypothetical protein GTU68_066006 [Idotea baltica]|nr:hypothetical protein [Idotea baltica]